MKLKEIEKILSQLEKEKKFSTKGLSAVEIQQLLCFLGMSDGNAYEELEMNYPLLDVHEDISESRDKVQIHSHLFYEILYCKSGKIQYLIETERYRLQAGDVVIIPPGISHRPLMADKMEEPYSRIVMWISREYMHSLVENFPELQMENPEKNLIRTANTRWEYIERYFRGAQLEFERQEPGWQSAASGYCLLLCSSLTRAMSSVPSMQSEKRGLLDEMMVYVETHLSNPLSVEQAAQHFHVSVSTVNQLFRKTLNTSFYRFLIQKRLILSKTCIQNGMSMEETARVVGFGDYSNFYRAFCKEYGLSPMLYKKHFCKDTL